ncbi:hypothetical protein JW933_09870, partial [candidate division FCPU426 bacterium]|nr:hypothetical protein [candidate division FCPU426 bacterium]
NTAEMEKMRMQAEEKLRLAVQDRRNREKQQAAGAANGAAVTGAPAAAEKTGEEKNQNIQVLMTQAQMYIHQNMLVEAMRLAQNILELDPQNKDVRNILVQIYEKKKL